MIFPTTSDLTKGKYNRYEVALATAKCARMITNEYVRQRAEAESSMSGNKETDRPVNTMIDRELRDEKAVKVAINRMYKGIYQIDLHAEEHPEDAEELWEAGNEAEEKLEEAVDSLTDAASNIEDALEVM